MQYLQDLLPCPFSTSSCVILLLTSSCSLPWPAFCPLCSMRSKVSSPFLLFPEAHEHVINDLINISPFRRPQENPIPTLMTFQHFLLSASGPAIDLLVYVQDLSHSQVLSVPLHLLFHLSPKNSGDSRHFPSMPPFLSMIFF